MRLDKFIYKPIVISKPLRSRTSKGHNICKGGANDAVYFTDLAQLDSSPEILNLNHDLILSKHYEKY